MFATLLVLALSPGLMNAPGLLNADAGSTFQATDLLEERVSRPDTAPASDPVLASDPVPGQEMVWEQHQVDVKASDLYVVTHKSGLLSFLGHEHAIIPMEWSGELCVPNPMGPGAGGAILIRTPSLIIDSDSARVLAGLGEGPGEDDVEEIQRTLLDGENLAAETHPVIRLESTVQGTREEEDGRLPVQTRLTLKGQTREFQHSVDVGPTGREGGPAGALHIHGVLEVPQTAFGIEPASVAGVVNVADEVELHFRLRTIPTGESCEPPVSSPEG